jgi:uncharacterized protein YbbC (DUF1343 family)
VLDDTGELRPVQNGADVLAADDFGAIHDCRLAIVTNHSGTLLDGTRTIDALNAQPEVILRRIFSPEHGLLGDRDDRFGDSRDDATGLDVFSLHGERLRPTPEQLEGIDIVLFDIQDVGARFYTYIATLGYVLEACAENHVAVFVLDRPNMIGGYDVDGPSSDPERESLVAYHPMPLRHGMTIGELARLFNVEREIGADLRVVTMAGWQRSFWFDNCGQPWTDPSPNIRDLTAAALYPGVGLLEGTNVSVGRGTESPFHVIGAPWMDGNRLAAALAHHELPGLTYEEIEFTPDDRSHPHAGELCRGVRFNVSDMQALPTAHMALALIKELRALHPHEWDYQGLAALLARPDLLEAIEDGATELDELWEPDPDFFEARAKALLY